MRRSAQTAGPTERLRDLLELLRNEFLKTGLKRWVIVELIKSKFKATLSP